MADSKIMTIRDNEWGFLGSTFTLRLPFSEAGSDGLYKIAKTDWNASIGPIFDRMAASITAGNKKNPDEYRAIANGYNAMTAAENRAFHTLLQSFAAATDPKQLTTYYGSPETNDYLARLMTFAEAYNGPEQTVLVSGLQLQALASIARGTIEYERENTDVTESSRQFNRDFLKGPGIGYSHGLINTLT